MTEPKKPAGTRIGDAERDTALTALGEHMRAGRLDPGEYSDRAAQVATARHVEDLVPLFHDLPFPAAGGGQQPTRDSSGASATKPIRSAMSGPARIMAMLGPLCLILFFVCGFLGGWSWSWVFFLVPGLVAVTRFGDKHEGRNRKRGRRNVD